MQLGWDPFDWNLDEDEAVRVDPLRRNKSNELVLRLFKVTVLSAINEMNS